MEITAEPTAYRIGPAVDLPDADQFAITVTRTTSGTWCARYRERYLTADGNWIPSPWTREPGNAAERAQFTADVESWKARVQHDHDTALALARAAAPHVEAMGMTASEYVMHALAA